MAMFSVGMNVGTTLTCAVQRKTLAMSNIAQEGFEIINKQLKHLKIYKMRFNVKQCFVAEFKARVGELFNVMSVDVKSVMDFLPSVHLFWSVPLQLSLAFFFLWTTLDGLSSLAGVLAMVVSLSLNAVLSSAISKLKSRQMRNKDNRVKIMSEILSGIKSIKLYAWEAFFEKKVKDIRKKEIHNLTKSAFFRSISLAVCSCSLAVVRYLN